MKQKQGADDRDDNKLFQQLEAERIDGVFNQLRAVVGWDDFYTCGQAFLYFL